MGMSWTEDQKKVIELRNRNILVSAAAGSGKTAVLVERIITMITEGEHPLDVDQLLVVTFTNAAAAEMRERIGAAIEKKLMEQPENVHLQKQMTLIHSAQIITIHSFCLNVIKNNFNKINLDPGFRIADEAELKLLKGDVLEDVLEKWYEAEDEKFLQFAESYAPGKTDAPIEEMVGKLHAFSMSYPWPIQWLEERKVDFSMQKIEEIEQTKWVRGIIEMRNIILEDCIHKNQEAVRLCAESDGPMPYLEALLADQQLLEELKTENEFSVLQQRINEVKWTALSRKKAPHEVNEEKKELVKSIREEIKSAVKQLQKQFFFETIEEILASMQKTKPAMEALIDLVIDFSKAFAERKEEKHLIDFHDFEHFALQILVENKGGKMEPSEVAKEYASHFEEILIDEYQDSNAVQETILTSISRERQGIPNIFMVGDVKQSIYKFRLAKPELFVHKYETYTETESLYQKIILKKNFRSRSAVLESINFIFYQIMKKFLGNIEYDKEAALYTGASFPAYPDERIEEESEVLIVSEDSLESEEEEGMEDEAEQEYSKLELEARAIGDRIKELTSVDNPFMIVDKETGEYRSCGYGDIVILLRTMSGWSEVFTETLLSQGISAYSDTQSGYFSTLEVKTMLNYLIVLDNPKQDIPLASVLRSVLGGITSEELAVVKSKIQEMDLYDSICDYADWEEAEEGICKKLHLFLNQLQSFREKIPYTPIHELLHMVYEETGYLDYVTVMPGGERRRANLMMLLQKAVEFEQTSYQGLFQFNRYIEKLHKYEVDFGEAGGESNVNGAVRIMSIHKSKGLEFPVVFVAGMGKTFNQQDARSKMVLDSELGIGVDCVDLEYRIKKPTLLKKVIQRKTMLENLGEELRVLYVALTRAKEKLIMTGFVKDYKKQMEKWEQKTKDGKQLCYMDLTGASQYFDWLIPAMIEKENAGTKIIPVTLKEIVKAESIGQIASAIRKQTLLDWKSEEVWPKLRESIESRMQYQYPFLKEQKLPGKVTVSQLKKMAQLSEEEAGEIPKTVKEAVYYDAKDLQEKTEKQEEGTKTIAEEFQEDRPIPRFLKQEELVSGADKGTLYHKVLEKISLERIVDKESVTVELDELLKQKILTEEERKTVNAAKIYYFAKAEIAKRMLAAKKENRLYLEQPFVIGLPANEICPEYESRETILVQGIIDVYFEEEDGLVLLDYKTDYVGKDGIEVLKQRYHSQLEYYQKALEQLTGKRVKEKVIYSLFLQREIIL